MTPPLTRTEALSLKLAWYSALKANSPCIVCEESDPNVIELHHKHPETKVSTVIELVKRNKPFEDINDETHKCIPLCCNCHRKFHKNSIDLKYLFETKTKEGIIVLFNRVDRSNIELTVTKDIDSLFRVPSIRTAMLRYRNQLELF